MCWFVTSLSKPALQQDISSSVCTKVKAQNREEDNPQLDKGWWVRVEEIDSSKLD